MTTPIIEDSGSSTYTYQGNNFNQLTINGKQINYFRDENPAVDTVWNWTNLFNLWDNLVATRSAQNPNILKIENTLRLTSDPSDNIMRDITATSNPATTLDVSANPLENFEYNLTMIRRGQGTDRILYIMDPSASNLVTYNGSLGQLTCPQINANIQSVNTTANATHFLGFFDSSATGYGRPQKNASLNFNPSTGNLSATRFIGDLSGNATSATNINISSSDTNATFYPTFVSSTGNQGLFIDSVITPLSYVPSSATLSIGNSTISSTNVTSGTGTFSTRLNLSYASSTATFSSGTLTLNAGATRSFQNFTFTMTANITAMTLTNLGTNGSFNLFLTGGSSDFTIAAGGSGGLGASILTSWSTAQTITANSRNLITIHYDNLGDRFYLRSTFGFTG